MEQIAAFAESRIVFFNISWQTLLQNYTSHILLSSKLNSVNKHVFKMALLKHHSWCCPLNSLSCSTDTTELWMSVASDLTWQSSHTVIRRRSELSAALSPLWMLFCFFCFCFLCFLMISYECSVTMNTDALWCVVRSHYLEQSLVHFVCFLPFFKFILTLDVNYSQLTKQIM